MKPPKLREIAARISAHLKRFEADKTINAVDPSRKMAIPPYHQAGAVASGRWVYVRYVSFQGNANLSRSDAERYLAWLDAGNVGTHYACWRDPLFVHGPEKTVKL